MTRAEITDHLALNLDLRVEAADDAGVGAFKATIELADLALQVEVTAPDLIQAMQNAAQRCSERLAELGFAVTAADVLGALEGRHEQARPWGPSASASN